jgi:hypothetical protein
MRIEQAIFTSVRGERMEGYQLAACSSGVDAAQAKELSAWGPAHESLLRDEPGATSVNFHLLRSGMGCLSKTTLAGAEYSGRHGGRVYTQLFLIPREGLDRFASNPFQLLRALTAGAKIRVCAEIPPRLPSLPLIGRATATAEELLAPALSSLDPEMLAELVLAVQSGPAVAVACTLRAERLFEAVLLLLPQEERWGISFSTGLRFSSRRLFRFYAAPSDQATRRQLARQTGVCFFDLSSSAEAES